MNQNLLWGNIIGRSSHVDFLEDIQTGDDEEDPGAPGTSPDEATQPEDDGSLVLLARSDQPDITGSQPVPGQLSPQRGGRAAGWRLSAGANILSGTWRTVRDLPRTLTPGEGEEDII